MRRAYNDLGFIQEGGVFIGVSLGYDFCAEHEWGIEDIKRKLNIPSLTRKTVGLKSRTMNVSKPENLFVYTEDGDITYLFVGQKYTWDERCSDRIPSYVLKPIELKYIDEEKDMLITAWDGKEFGMMAKGAKEREMLKELHANILKNNMTITYINAFKLSPFSRSSLCILISDRIKEEYVNQMKAADNEYLDLQEIKNKLDLEKKIRPKFSDYSLHYCGPSFITHDSKEELEKRKKEKGTKHDVIYWLNSSDVYGWFTVEQLQELANKLTLQEFKEKYGR